MKLVTIATFLGMLAASGDCLSGNAADDILVYRVDPASRGRDFSTDRLLEVINRRLEALEGLNARAKSLEPNSVEVTVSNPHGDETERVKRVLEHAAGFELRILANNRDHAALIRNAAETFPEPVLTDGEVRARWLPVAPGQSEGFTDYGAIVVRKDANETLFVLVVQDSQNVTSAQLVDVRRARDETGHPAIRFKLNPEGGRRFSQLTGANLPTTDGFRRRLGIIVIGQLHSAPSLMARIGQEGMITGRFTDDEVDAIIAVLRAGDLPARLVGPLSDEKTE